MRMVTLLGLQQMDTAAGRILVVDDDPSLRECMAIYLRRLGYEVIACPDGEEAWALVEAAPLSFALALVDVSLPGMRGDELARRILASNASIAVITASGYPEDVSRVDGADGHRVSFLQKPFAPAQLVRAVQAHLPVKADNR